MIVPMIRYNFLLLSDDVPEFMERIRKAGVVDITTTGWEPDPVQRQLLEEAERYKLVAQRLKSVSPPENTALEPYPVASLAVEEYEHATERHARMFAERLKATGELDEIRVWGDFDPDDIKRLKENGIDLRFFYADTKSFRPEWEYEYPVEVIARSAGRTYFVVSQTPGDNPVVDLRGATEVRAPGMSVAQKEAQIENLIRLEQGEQEIIARAALSRQAIHDDYLRMQDQLAFSAALGSGSSHADGTVKIIEGWSVVADRPAIEQLAEASPAIYSSEAAKAGQNPPIKLKNNFFARLFEPIGDLYMLPRYDELDLTPYFAPFFMLFFAICFGDAGYALLLIVAVLALWHKIPANFKDYGRLVLWLAGCTVLVGACTGALFGIELAKIDALAQFKDKFITSDQMFSIALVLGGIQIIFGQILRIFERIKRHDGKIAYGLSTLGWVIIFISIALVVMELVPGFTAQSPAFLWCLAAGGVLIFFLNSPGKNPLVNIGSGLYNCYETATGIIGDLLSYIRLFAIGMAGGVIAQVFNSLAVGMSGDIPVLSFIFMAVILFIGHGLNIFVSALGAFVHPVRLTFVEFFKNAEFEGGGRRFTPLRKQIDN